MDQPTVKEHHKDIQAQVDAYIETQSQLELLRFITCGSVDDDRFNLLPGETIELRKVRFRTLGCYPLTGAVESSATDLSQIVLELLQSRTSEREGRAIDSDSNASMEKKKQEGYF